MSLELQSDGPARQPVAPTMRIPDGFNPTTFRAVLAAFTTGWRLQGRLPTAEETRSYWPMVPVRTVEEVLATPEFREACLERGIELGDTPGLTHVQHMALMALSDPYDKRSLKAKLQAAGASTQQYANWQRSPMWQAARKQLGARLWEDGLEDLKTRMLQSAEGGNFQAAQYILDTLGEGPKGQQQANAQEIVQRFVSAISRATVGHPDIREKILVAMREDMIAVQALTE